MISYVRLVDWMNKLWKVARTSPSLLRMQSNFKFPDELKKHTKTWGGSKAMAMSMNGPVVVTAITPPKQSKKKRKKHSKKYVVFCCLFCSYSNPKGLGYSSQFT